MKAPVSKTGIPVNPVSRVRISPCPSGIPLICARSPSCPQSEVDGAYFGHFRWLVFQTDVGDGWPSGLRRTPGKCVYVNSVPWVRIPPRPLWRNALAIVAPLSFHGRFRDRALLRPASCPDSAGAEFSLESLRKDTAPRFARSSQRSLIDRLRANRRSPVPTFAGYHS